MGTFAKHIILCHIPTSDQQPHRPPPSLAPPPPPAAEGRLHSTRRRWTLLSSVLTASSALGLRPPAATAEVEQRWGTRSFFREKYFEPGLSPDEAAARIRQTAEGMRNMRHMLDTMSWRYVLFYVRLKSAYLDADLKNAMATVPQARRQSYVKTANELVDNMSELDRHIRSPKVYESYLYYEKTLKSLDDLVSLLA
ncbi:photosynthetic NDH subunit of lumenal location 2, chloroplastic-like [Zingiber officinale]|uniref:Photosynthetic NDH subcomplex L 2 n=1 Tax=Zingiber officinale TaxID=94328 RepID=A0A8J5M4S5_ZINOF|nr:photosynthetic NDH subunit of lumenal location 2, chloroplastic-like [Zingiber officinale]KAG6534131.1 hypothetical protein ZIOFF_008015 [Zingiber officinale]